jgi:hypothetical protein
VPLFSVESTTAGTGKTLLCDLAAEIVLGASAPRSPAPPNDDELRKRLLAHGVCGDSLIVIDNVPSGGALGWPSLDAAITSPVLRDRVLGATQIVSLPNGLTICATGNNLQTRGDTARRVLRIRLESDLERPEDRTGFAVEDIRAHVREQRPRLLGAVLTILSAYLSADRPGVGVGPLGSFERWSSVVRSAVIWAGGADPVGLLASRSADADPAVEAHVALLAAWDVPRRAADLVALVASEPSHPLAAAVVEIVGDRVDAKRVARKLRELRGRRRTTTRGGQRVVAYLDRRDRETTASGSVGRVWIVVVEGGEQSSAEPSGQIDLDHGLYL